MNRIVAKNAEGFDREFCVGDKLEVIIDSKGAKDVSGVLKRIIDAGERLSSKEVREYYGTRPPKGAEVTPRVHRMIIAYNSIGHDFYLIVPVKAGSMRYSGQLTILKEEMCVIPLKDLEELRNQYSDFSGCDHGEVERQQGKLELVEELIEKYSKEDK